MRILISVIFFSMISCSYYDQSEYWSYEDNIERELSIEKTDEEDLTGYLNELLVTEYNICGQWDSKDWHDGVHLIIKPRTDGKYAVIYYARGDLARWTLMRVATFKKGVLTFEKAVKEYAPVIPYTRFYLLKSPNGSRFVSQADCRYHFVKNKNVDWDIIEFSALEMCDRTCRW